MIKINLLPTKKRTPKKLVDLQQQLILGALILVLLLVGMFYASRSQNRRIADLQTSKAESEARIRAQDAALREVKDVENTRKQVQEKIEIIEQLKADQTGPVHLLDEISKALPKSVNIQSLSEHDHHVDLNGEAFTNDDLVQFVNNLKASPALTDVVLLESSRSTAAGIDLYKYRLAFVYKGF